MNAFTSFAPLLERCANYDALKSDAVAPTRQMRFEEDGQLIVPTDFGATRFGMEDLPLGQLADRLGRYFWKTSKRSIPSDYFRQLYSAWPQHFAPFTNDLLDSMDGSFLVRSYGENVRAVLSSQYATLDNSEMLDMTSQVLDGVPYEIVESGKYYARNDGVQRDEMVVRVIVKNVSPKDEGGYGLGVLIRNGETGGSASEVRPLVMRTSCMNSLVFRQAEDGTALGLRLTHRGSKQSKAILLASAIAEALPMAEQGLERYLETKRTKIDLKGVIARLGEEQDWSEEVRLTVGVGSEGHETVYGLINGLTFAAHELDVDASDRFDMEALAAQFVYQPALVTGR
jgi:hypothetical protein